MRHIIDVMADEKTLCGIEADLNRDSLMFHRNIECHECCTIDLAQKRAKEMEQRYPDQE